jgi:dolichol kinase
MVIVGLIYLLYPLRLVRFSRKAGSTRPFWRCIRVSAAFDPAEYIYPTVLPGIVALSLFKQNPAAMVPNLVLGIAALPTHVLGFQYDNSRFMKHWLLTLVPAVLSRFWSANVIRIVAVDSKCSTTLDFNCNDEFVTFLLPLHSNIVPLLHSFTKTSLLPAELQLLSVSLLTLLLLSNSPQSKILAIILWVGGLGTIALCGPVINWGVALARVPRWRLRRAGRIIQARQTFIKALNDIIKRKRQTKKDREIVESDADDDFEHQSSAPRKGLDLPTLKTEVLNALKQNFFPDDDDESRSAVEKPMISGREWPSTPSRPDKRRRHTVSNAPTQAVNDLPERSRRKHSKVVPDSYFATLTPEQATLRKWSYAAYLYLIMALLVLLPIRSLVSYIALNGSEPFGWAIGYLGGNLQALRFRIIYYNLDGWIPLPPLMPSTQLTFIPYSGIENIRSQLGAANTRLVLSIYSLLILSTGLFSVLTLPSQVEVDTRRKVFHGIMVGMLLPTIYIDPPFFSLALTITLAIFLILDTIRASQLPPLSKPLASFLTPYVDGRDLRGPVVISHIFLLVGCSVPLWLALAATTLRDELPWRGWQADTRDVSMLAGVICVGMGDAAASLIGRRFGRHKWPWSGGKSLEGSSAFALTVSCGLLAGKVWLVLGRWKDINPLSGAAGRTAWALVAMKIGVAASAASLMEAVLTGGNDNVVVPVFLWVFVRALRI